jgi:adenine deaminase
LRSIPPLQVISLVGIDAKRIAVARGDRPADLVLKGGHVFSVFTREWLDVDVALSGGLVAGLGTYDGERVIDVSGAYVVPGFIDGHVHVESSKLLPDQLARAIVPRGTTAVVADPHEIANVLGMRGVRWLLNATRRLPLDIFVMAPSCVPASPFESPRETVTPDQIAELQLHHRVLGVAEMMNYPGVVAGDPLELAKLDAANHVDGHAPRLAGPQLNAYAAAGIRSDHESVTYQEALEKRRLGMWIMLREASGARNLADLLPLVLEHGPERCLLCTDDREPDFLVEEGHLDQMLRKAVALGVTPEDALVMATLNPATYHRLWNLGGVAPGYQADLVVLEDLVDFGVRMVLKRGSEPAYPDLEVPDWVRGTMNAAPVSASSFHLPPLSGQMRVIGVVPGQLLTTTQRVEPCIRDGATVADPSRDLVKIAVVERHHASGRVGVAFATNVGLREGAYASTVAHDAHNVVVLGVDDEDMAVCVRRLGELGGGIVVAAAGRVVGELPLPVAGLMSDRPLAEVHDRLLALEADLRALGVRGEAPFMTLSFLALSVIPELKITDRGLVDVGSFQIVPLATG